MTTPQPVAALRFTLLGPVQAWRDGRRLPVGTPQQQAVLVALLLHRPRPVCTAQLVDGIWGEQAPPGAVCALRAYVSRLRAVLRNASGSNPVVATAGGYLLELDDLSVDVDEFDRLLDEAGLARAEGRLARARAALEQALALGDGDALTGVPGSFAEIQRGRIAERFLFAQQQRAELDLELGRHAELVAPLTELCMRHPLREELCGLLMLALYRSGRQADSMAAYLKTQRLLAQELGVEPGPELQQLYHRILTKDPVLAPKRALSEEEGSPEPISMTVPASAASASGAVVRLPRALVGFVERMDVWKRLDELCRPEQGAGLVVVAGPAGSGKTCLVVRWAHGAQERFPDGRIYLDLRGFSPEGPAEPGEVLGELLRVLGVPAAQVPQDTNTRAMRYQELVRARRMLLVLDNVAWSADVRLFLPEGGAAVTVLCSRDALQPLIAGEGADFLRLGGFSTAEAAELVRLRLGENRAVADPQATERLVELCGRLPLALSIALARLVVSPEWAVADLVAELEDEQARLSGLGLSGGLSFEQALSLSARRLPQQARRLLSLLALHPGSEIVPQVAAALLDQPLGVARRALAELSSMHLLTETSPGRYQAHDLVALYCSRLQEQELTAPQRLAAIMRVLEYFVAATAAAAKSSYPVYRPEEPDQAPLGGVPVFTGLASAMEWFRGVESVVRALVLRAVEHGLVEHSCRLAQNAGVLYYDHGALHEWTQALTAALRAAQDALIADRWPRLYSDHSVVLTEHGEFAEALADSERAMRLIEERGEQHDPYLANLVRRRLASALIENGRAGDAIPHLEAIAAAARKLGDVRRAAQALNNLANAYLRQGRPTAALSAVREALQLMSGRTTDLSLAICMQTLAESLHALGDTEAALAESRRALALARAQNNARQELVCANFVGRMLEELGRPSEARLAWERALELATAQGRQVEMKQLAARLAHDPGSA